MEDSYKEMDDSTEPKNNIVTAMTKKLKDYMVKCI